MFMFLVVAIGKGFVAEFPASFDAFPWQAR
jgi:hypothetical protein